jgi:hypothetical protein
MKTLLTLLLAAFCAATGYGQTMKALMYNTNGQVVLGGISVVQFTNNVAFAGSTLVARTNGLEVGKPLYFTVATGTNIFEFEEPLDVATARTNLALGATWLTNTNVTNFRTAIGLGAEDSPQFDDISSSSANISGISANSIDMNGAISWTGTNATANAATTRTNLGLGATWLTNTNVTNFRTAIGLGATDGVVFAAGLTNNVGIGVESTNTGLASGGSIQGGLGLVQNGNLVARFDSFDGIRVYRQIKFDSGSAETRTNLGLPLQALTNTSDVTMMRALSGSTNTNHPFSGSVSVVGTNNTNTLVFSNGILQEVQ